MTGPQLVAFVEDALMAQGIARSFRQSGDIDRCGGGLGKNTYLKCEKRIPGDHET